jgi:non-ribosomal peptide synthase protein (TIGR01720 family)
MDSCEVVMGREQTSRLLQEAPAAYHTEINDLLLSALAMTLGEWSGRDKVVIGLEGHGREDILPGVDISRTVGWFTTLYPVLLEGVEAAEEIGAVVRRVKEQLRKVPDKGLGYGVLRYLLGEEGLGSRGQCWNIVFNYMGQSDNVVNTSEWLSGAEEPMGAFVSEGTVRETGMEVNSIVSGGELRIRWNYSRLHYKEGTIQRLSERYVAKLEEVTGYCLQQLKTGGRHTPSDYGLGEEVSNEELDDFLNKGKGTQMDVIINF